MVILVLLCFFLLFFLPVHQFLREIILLFVFLFLLCPLLVHCSSSISSSITLLRRLSGWVISSASISSNGLCCRRSLNDCSALPISWRRWAHIVLLLSPTWHHKSNSNTLWIIQYSINNQNIMSWPGFWGFGVLGFEAFLIFCQEWAASFWAVFWWPKIAFENDNTIHIV